MVTHSLKHLAISIIVMDDLRFQPGDGCRMHGCKKRLWLALPKQRRAQDRPWLDVAKELVPWSAWNMPQRVDQVLRVPVPDQLPHILIVVRRVRDVVLINMVVLVENE